MYRNDPASVLSGEVRLSYVKLAEAKVNPNQPNSEPEYSVTLLIPKTDKATKAAIDAAIAAVANAAVNKVWGGVRPANFKTTIHDGDGIRPSGSGPYGEECKGMWVLSTKRKASRGKPWMCDISSKTEELNPLGLYSGVYARCIFHFYAYSNSGNKGISCEIDGVMRTRDGEPLGGAVMPTASIFDGADVEPVDNATPYGATVPANAPVFPPSTAPYIQGYSGYGQNAAAAPTQGYTPMINPITGLPM